MTPFSYTLICDNKIINGTVVTVTAKNESAAQAKVHLVIGRAHSLGNYTLSRYGF